MNINDIKIMLLKGDKGDKGDGSYDDTELRELIAETFADVQEEIAQLEQNYLNYMYPVGSIYISVGSTSPAVLFGGTWEKIEGKFLLASSSTHELGSTGGEEAHTLTIDEIPSHTHGWTAPTNIDAIAEGTATTIHEVNRGQQDEQTGAVGGGQAHNNMPPYLTVNVWKRTA
ncbi:MAG: hypothetical protein J6Y78_15010 [Paludibacteraceae bacterium]|nr:hypothetical protein [Paludibacteraceae bacterium]